MNSVIIKTAAAVASAILVLLALSACRSEDDAPESTNSQPIVTEPAETIIETEAVAEDESVRYGYTCLTAEQRKIYDLLCGIKTEGEYTFDAPKKYSDVYRARYFYNKDYGELSAFGMYNSMSISIQISDNYVKSHPEYVDYSFGKKLLAVPAIGEMIELDGETVPVDGFDISFSGVGGYTSEEVSEMERQFINEADEWLAKLPGEDASDIEKARAIACLICDKVTYEQVDLGDNPYGGVVNGKLFCEGYARTFRYFANELGLESILVSGESFGEGHMWNKAKIDGNWYNIDVTWMDTAVDGEYNDNYFLKSDDRFSTDHAFNASGDLYIEPEEWSAGFEMPLSPVNYGE